MRDSACSCGDRCGAGSVRFAVVSLQYANVIACHACMPHVVWCSFWSSVLGTRLQLHVCGVFGVSRARGMVRV